MKYEPIRLQKFMSDAGVMSRRAAEEAISEGKILVNGEPATIGQKVNPERDEVRYEGKRVYLPDNPNKKTYILLNKPRGFVTTMKDEMDRKCVASLVADVGCRVYPVGRLDKVSEGMLIMTNDGEFANYMTHPGHEVPKYYNVRIEGEITKEQLAALSAPMELDGYDIRPVHVTVLEVSNGNSTIQMELYEGRNRQIRKMCEQVGLQIIRLKRIAIGSIPLGSLPIGKWRYLTAKELTSLMPSEEKRFRVSEPREVREEEKKKQSRPTYKRSRPLHVPSGHSFGHAKPSMRKIREDD